MTLLQSFGQDRINLTAAAQQLCLWAAAGWDLRAAVDSLIGPDGEVLRFRHQRDTWPPSYVLVKQGANYFLAMYGTSNVNPQVFWHIEGTFSRTTKYGVTLHGQWVDAWEQVWADVGPLVSFPGPAGKLFLSGHSYGGALCTIGAMEAGQAFGPGRTEVMTFGAPKVSTAPVSIANGPDPYWRLNSYQDIVPSLPDNHYLWGLAQYALPGPITSLLLLDWFHVGELVPIGPAGTLGFPGPTPTPLPPLVELGPIVEHHTANYLGRIQANGGAGFRASPLEQALAIGNAIVSAPYPQNAVDLPPVVPGPGATPFRVPYYAGVLAAPAKGDPMTFPVPIVGADIFRLAEKINMPDGGFDEAYFLAISTTDPAPLATLNTIAVALGAQRANILSTFGLIAGCEQGRAEQAGAGQVYFQKTQGADYPGLNAGAPAEVRTSWGMRSNDDSGDVQGERVYRGWPASDVTLSGTGGSNLSTNITAAQLTFINYLRTLTVAGAPGRLAARFVVRDPDNVPPQNVTAFALDTSGNLEVTVPGVLGSSQTGAPPYTSVAIGDRVQVTVSRDSCVRGVSGNYRVTAIANGGGPTTYTLALKPRCNAASIAALNGSARAYVKDWCYVTGLNWTRILARDTGPRFFAGRGARRAR